MYVGNPYRLSYFGLALLAMFLTQVPSFGEPVRRSDVETIPHYSTFTRSPNTNSYHHTPIQNLKHPPTHSQSTHSLHHTPTQHLRNTRTHSLNNTPTHNHRDPPSHSLNHTPMESFRRPNSQASQPSSPNQDYYSYLSQYVFPPSHSTDTSRHPHPSTNSSHTHNHHHRHYRDHNHHKVRHHRELRRLRKRSQGNQHQPKFDYTQYQETVPENLKVHSSILQVHATDDDLDHNGLIQYSVSDPVNFGIDEGGVLYNLRPLDYEHTNGEYLLYVYAEDQGVVRTERKRTSVPIYLHVRDTQEPPYFDDTQYAFSVSEFARKGIYVGTVVARDADQDFDHYELVGQDAANKFVVNRKTGIITLDTDDFNDQWQFTFQAKALDKEDQHSSVPVTVDIIDENTHKPVFELCNDVKVKEGQPAGQPVIVVQATDADHGVNGEVSYYLLNDFDSFDIQTYIDSGQITTTKELDRDEADREFFLTVIAKDGAPANEALQEACTFKVMVDDINDNPPIFDEPVYSQKIATDHNTELAVLRVTSTDMDTGKNAQLEYSLDGSAEDVEYFKVDPTLGIITLTKGLNSDMAANNKIFRLDAVATDKGDVPLSGKARVNIEVVSSGSLPPEIIERNPQAPAIPENANENTDVVTLCAISNVPGDPDVYFSMLPGNTVESNSDGTFAKRDLDPDDPACPRGSRGVVIFVAIRNLDYESCTAYRLILRVLNKEGAMENVPVTVDIIDVNDNPPLLRQFDGGAIVENSASALITTIEAIDKDASEEFKQLVFSFDKTASADVMRKFKVYEDGQLWTTMPLDREEVDRYMVPIRVTDGVDTHSRMNIYWITVQDINDVSPRFDTELGVYQVQVDESREPGWKTGIDLRVIDPDIVNHNDFQIVQGNEKRKFRIDSTTGEVFVDTQLDYDQPSNDRNFTMLVRLSDGANAMAEMDITIAVINVNDQPPEFVYGNYTFDVTENTQCNEGFGQVTAMDPDLPSTVDQNIFYYFTPDELTNFTIGENTGQISIVGCLDREAATMGIMTLYPRAMDEGGRGHDAKPTNVRVNIQDLNDNHPYIQSPEHSYTKFLENAAPATVTPVIIQLNDWDTQEHGCPCTLSFLATTEPDILNKFKVEVLNQTLSQYQLRPLVMLDREAQKFYQIPFTTTDREGVRGTRHLTVEVGDVNDSPMTDGSSAIQVYNYQGQFPTMVIGSVYVTDEDDHDIGDKHFEMLPDQELTDIYFFVDPNSGNITMNKGTPEGVYRLRVRVRDSFRNETATGTVEVLVVELTEEAVVQSGSFRVAGYSALQLLQQQEDAVSGTSLYEKLKRTIGELHDIPAMNVDIFNLRDVGGGDGSVDVRYNCHSSPYYTAPRLDGLMITHRKKLNDALGVNISMVTMNDCLYEASSPCGTGSCQQFLRPNLTAPLVVAGDTTTMVGVQITPEYNCVCGALEPPASACYPGFCLNHGTCMQENNTLACECPDGDYGPRCELRSARFERGYAWYQAPKVCDNSTLLMSFSTNIGDGLLLYSGPLVEFPWYDYPSDFIYVVIRDWMLEVYLDLGSGTIKMNVPLEEDTGRIFDCSITWNEAGVTLEVAQCLEDGVSVVTPPECRQSLPLVGSSSPSHLLNLAAPLQLGGVAAMASISALYNSYPWTIEPPYVEPFYGCILEFQYNNILYDLNSTDYDKNTFKPCNAPKTAKIIVGKQSIIIIVVSLLCLLLLVLLILCLARRKQKTISYPDLDGIVKETIGGSDLEGFGEKDMTQYDLKLLRVGPDGYLFSGSKNGGPKLTDELRQKKAPIAPMPDLSIGEFINDNIKKVDKDPSDFDDVRHYCFEGDEMSIASLSSIGSGGSSDSDSTFDYKNDWGHRFEKLNEIYKRGSDEEDESDYEFPDVPKQRKRISLPPPVREPRSPTTTSPGQSPADLGPGPGPDLPSLDPSLLGRTALQQGQTDHAFKPVTPFTEVEGAESWC